jgi:pyruvate/2-oxoglutarate dehydrogenase complex dihydrolipoamide dehydrogenase (E3) component
VRASKEAGFSRPRPMVREPPQQNLPHAGIDDSELCLNGRPGDWRNPTQRKPYHLIVIGAGPAGLVAARAAAALGARVALIEKHLLGGLSLNYGCVPSQALIRTSRLYAQMRNAELYGAQSPVNIEVDFLMAMARMRRVRARASRTESATRIASAGIDLYFGAATFVGPNVIDVNGQQLRFKKAMIATGSRSLLPTIPGLEAAGYMTNETLFELTVLPKTLLVIGGGPVGCQVAQALCRFGSRVIIAHAEPLFLPKEERDAAQLVAEALARDGVEIHLNTRAVNVRVEGGQKLVETLNDGNVATITVDAILTGIGRTPALSGLNLDAAGVKYDVEKGILVDDFLRTSNRRIFAAGDVCLENKYTDTAEASARIVVRNALCFGRERLSALTIPWCTYTDPEIAHVGLYVRQARERGISVKTYTVPMHDVDRALTDAEESGFVKIHVLEGSDKILGATVVATHAGEMINDLSLAIVAGIGLGTIARVIHAYPTQAEGIKKAAMSYASKPATRWKAWLRRCWFGNW